MSAAPVALTRRVSTHETAHRLAELQWLLDGGVWPDDAVARAGFPSASAASRAASRRGMHRISRMLDSHASATRHDQAERRAA